MGLKKVGLHDINKLPLDGYVIFPISMSKASNAQNPENCYKWLGFFEKKIQVFGLDAIFLYTNGLYYNNDESALEVRKKTNGQMISHSNAIRKLIVKNRKYIPKAIHFIPWDYLILNSQNYSDFYLTLKECFKEDKTFAELIKVSLNGRAENEANINFLIEELAVNHIVRQRLVDLPKTLVKEDKFRLFAYPGEYMKSDLYAWKKKLLPQKENLKSHINPYYAAQYDLDKEILYNFDEIELEDIKLLPIKV
jgi:hypothetical protein